MHTIYYIIAIVSWIVIGMVWIVGIFGNKKTLARPDVRKYLGTTLLLIVSYILVFNTSLSSPLNSMITSQHGFTALLGAALAVLGAVVAIWARLILGRSWSGSTATLKQDHKLAQKGPYRFMRHPIYTGLFMAMLGLACTIGLLGNYIGVVLGLIALLIRIPTEEKLMVEQFPNEYPEYMKRTKKLIPFAW